MNMSLLNLGNKTWTCYTEIEETFDFHSET